MGLWKQSAHEFQSRLADDPALEKTGAREAQAKRGERLNCTSLRIADNGSSPEPSRDPRRVSVRGKERS